MPALREALAASGMTDVRTYLQSGNVIAQSRLRTHGQVSNHVRQVLVADFSLDVPVITRRPAELDQVIAANPFAAQATQRAHLVRVVFLAGVPSAPRIEQMMADDALRDTCRVVGDHVYVDYVRGYHGTGRTATYFTRALEVDGTERNWRTVLALSEIAGRHQRPAPAVAADGVQLAAAPDGAATR